MEGLYLRRFLYIRDDTHKSLTIIDNREFKVEKLLSIPYIDNNERPAVSFNTYKNPRLILIIKGHNDEVRKIYAKAAICYLRGAKLGSRT